MRRRQKFWMKNGRNVLQRSKKIRVGIFFKISMGFILIGLVPLLLISNFFVSKFSDNTEKVVLNDTKIILNSAAGYIDTILEEWDEASTQMYQTEFDTDTYLEDIILDDKLSGEEKEQKIQKSMSKLGNVRGLQSIRFLDKYGNFSYSSEIVGKVLNKKEMDRWCKTELRNRGGQHKMEITSSHKDIYFSNKNTAVFTVKRNLFCTSSTKKVNQLLGTIYLDISLDVIEQQLAQLNLGEQSGFYLINKTANQIYISENQGEIPENIREKIAKKAQTTSGILETTDSYYVYQPNQDAQWISIIRKDKKDVLANFVEIRKYIFTILLFSSGVLMLIYFVFSNRISKPIRLLQKGMREIQQGNFDTRVSISRKDEFGILADGLNRMAEQLNEYVEQVYVAEIKQRETELNMLKSQIQPHYLYNTLDIIRMTAVSNEDEQTAEMIECLGSQLRYLIEGENDMVLLEEELQNIKDYFYIMKIRYEGRIKMKISVSKSLKKVSVLKLIMQPLVENAMKHGLRDKQGEGFIWVTVKQRGLDLEISVMDDGVGMDEERLRSLKNQIGGEDHRKHQKKEGGIGLSNVNERVQKKYGSIYGLDVESTQGVGTIVKLRIPVILPDMEEKKDV